MSTDKRISGVVRQTPVEERLHVSLLISRVSRTGDRRCSYASSSANYKYIPAIVRQTAVGGRLRVRLFIYIVSRFAGGMLSLSLVISACLWKR